VKRSQLVPELRPNCDGGIPCRWPRRGKPKKQKKRFVFNGGPQTKRKPCGSRAKAKKLGRKKMKSFRLPGKEGKAHCTPDQFHIYWEDATSPSALRKQGRKKKNNANPRPLLVQGSGGWFARQRKRRRENLTVSSTSEFAIRGQKDFSKTNGREKNLTSRSTRGNSTTGNKWRL